jgi:hypothetical protein
MTGVLQLTEVKNPLAQTFRVTEPGGSVITSVGIYFSSAPASGDAAIPITLELRPVANGGNPSSNRYIPGSRTTASAAAVRAVASTTFSGATEYKFTFREPVYVKDNTEVAIVLSTGAPVGQYKVWMGKQGNYVAGSSNSQLITSNLNTGVMFMSSNGTAWSKDQYADLAFKVYRAKFGSTQATAYLVADAPPIKKLTENLFTNDILKYRADPLIMTAGSKKVKVAHPAHGFQVGDKVKLSADSDGLDSADTVNGISAAQILKTHTVDSADPYGYTITTTSNATASLRGGGTSLRATEQYVVDEAILQIPVLTPPFTTVEAFSTMTTTKSFGGSETAYQTSTEGKMPISSVMRFRDPYVVASTQQETDASKLNGNPSSIFKIKMNTENAYGAPYINVNAAALKVHSNFIDYQDSDTSSVANRNFISTVDFTAESSANGGTTAAKHISIPYTLENSATSIRVMVDAIRPKGADFEVWFRTAQTADEDDIKETDWTAFSKTIKGPNTSNYSQVGNSETFRQFEFNVYDVADFDQYQIKITMSSNKSTVIPIFANLRTIATV